MLIETFYFSDITASLVRYEPGESHFIEPMSEQKPCLGVLFLSGSWKLHNSGVESGVEDLGLHIPNADGTWPRSFWNDYTAEDYCEGGPNGVEWLCAEQSAAGSRGITLDQSPLILPAFTGLLIASGNVTIGDPAPPPIQVPTRPEIVDGNNTFRLFRNPIELDSGTGSPLSYFRPASIDRDVVGEGQVLLVSPTKAPA